MGGKFGSHLAGSSAQDLARRLLGQGSHLWPGISSKCMRIHFLVIVGMRPLASKVYFPHTTGNSPHGSWLLNSQQESISLTAVSVKTLLTAHLKRSGSPE